MEKPTNILLLDFSHLHGLNLTIQNILKSSDHTSANIYIESISTVRSAYMNFGIDFIPRYDPEILIITVNNNNLNHLRTFLKNIGVREITNELPVLLVIDEGAPKDMLDLLELGINDFITTPIKAVDVLPRVLQLLERTPRADVLLRNLKEKLGLKQIIGESPKFLRELEKIPLIAKCDASVLIRGESGTGKELFARAIHYLSSRSTKSFVPVNCGAIPTELVENELFGHEHGAFTGASTTRHGLIKEAHGGTLVLDEIDCLPLHAQVKILRFLQEKEYRPLGSTKMCKVDVRVLAATNTNLEQAMSEGCLRKDLYYRLNIIPVTLPPLRERREDIPLLSQHFIAKYAKRYNKRDIKLSPEALSKFLLYDWPGNVRELENMIERVTVLCKRTVILGEDILPNLESPSYDESFQNVKAKYIATFERNYITQLLRSYKGNITKAANAAKKNRRAFWQLIRKHRINASRFKS